MICYLKGDINMAAVKTWAIIGGGNGGQTMAGHLGMMGQKVRLFDVMQKTVDELNALGEIRLEHAVEGVGPIEFATTDMAQAIRGAENIIIVLPAIYLEGMARKMAPYLQDGQVVLIHPETCCGAIAFRKVIRDCGCTANLIVGSACNLIYATRILKNGHVHVHGLKRDVKIAALPATDNEALLAAVGEVFPMFSLTKDILHISTDNMNAMMHPGPSLLNMSRIEARPFIPYQYYREGITPSVGRFVEAMDRERIAIAAAFGYEQRSINQSYVDMYACGTVDDSIDVLVGNNKDYDGIMTSDNLWSRYMFEDIPYNLCAFSALGHVAGVPTPCIDAIITIGRAVYGDRLDEGRTLETLGLVGVTKEELLAYIKGN